MMAVVNVLCILLALAEASASSFLTQDQLMQAANSSLLWGPYRSNLYVGIRPRIPDSLMTGLMWTNVNNYENFQDLRHSCEQGEDMGSYGWEEYDARRGGKHVVRDIKMGLDLTTHFVKTADDHWALRVRGTPRAADQEDMRTTVIFYAGLDGSGTLSLQDGSISGAAPGLGQFSISMTGGDKAQTLSEQALSTGFLGLKVPAGTIWRAKDFLLDHVRGMLSDVQQRYAPQNFPEPSSLYQLPDSDVPGSNLFFLQSTFEGSFEFDIIYQSGPEHVSKKVTNSGALCAQIQEMSLSFHEKFEHVFKFTTPFDATRYKAFGKVLFSNLIGGIGYFHGSSIVDRSYSTSYDEEEESFWENAAVQLAASEGAEEGPSTLFTAVPSRAFFPRGFYWDEGFHLMPIGLWDQDLSLEIIKSWFSLVDEDGWIAREQILGAEARSKVPPEFRTQYPHYANPPTLFIAIDQFLERLDRRSQSLSTQEYVPDFNAAGMPEDEARVSVLDASAYLDSPELALQYLQSLYPILKRHFEWFRKTQRGEVKAYDREAHSSKEAYRWRGRTPDHCLTSGIDDYPRARPPHPGELHLDLHSWMAMMTKLLRNIAEKIGQSEDAEELARIESLSLLNLDDLHWSSSHQAYCDQTIDAYEESVPVCHLGYISIFPVLLGLLHPDHPNLGAVLNLMRDQEHLWSPYGLRSLSKQDSYYGTGEDYWRGSIWININYLALSSLYRNYAFTPGPQQALAASIYQELRSNLVRTVEQEYNDSGVIWEQYNAETGRGQRTKAFTGWTSMIVNIMAERY